jgi:hypothetical protein
MSYAIISDSRKGQELGIEILALVDRRKTKKLWWISDDSRLIMNFKTKVSAQLACSRLKRNNARIVSYKNACKYIDRQEDSICHYEAEEFCGLDYLSECGDK